MAMCERCWTDAYTRSLTTGRSQSDIYHELLEQRECTPEQQAGTYATTCPECGRLTCHQQTGECMVCEEKG